MRLKVIFGGLLAALCFLASPALGAPAAASPSPHPRTPPVPTSVAAPSAAKVLTREDLEAWLDGYMPYALQRGDVAGAVVVVVKDGQVLLQKGYG
ncbi:MAG: hypothetical protein ACREE0_00050, partial [Phenylobacterium sp.]